MSDKKIQMTQRSSDNTTWDNLYPKTTGDQVLAADGTTTFQSHLGDYVRQPGYAVATGSANTYAVTLSPAPTAYIDGMAVCVKINVASTGASTINVNGLGAKTILDSLGNAITAGGLKANTPYTLRYNGTNFIVQGKGGGGNTIPAHVLSGDTYTVDSGSGIGTMPNKSGVNLGSGVPANGVTSGSKFDFDIKLPTNGYMDTSTAVHQTLTNLITSNVLSGVTIPEIMFTGSAIDGKKLNPGDTLLYTDTTGNKINGVPSTTPLKVYEIKITGAYGTVRLKWTALSEGSSGILYMRPYVNGNPVGTQVYTNNSSYTAFSQDIMVNDGDLIQLWGYMSRYPGAYGDFTPLQVCAGLVSYATFTTNL